MSIAPTTMRPADDVDGHPRRLSRTGRATEQVAGWLARHSIGLLRISLGLVFLGFGALKFVPGASPAEDLAIRTLDRLSLGILSGQPALLATAVAETFIGVTLISGRLLKAGLVVLGVSMVGILSPLVLFFPELFPVRPPSKASTS